MVLPGLYDTKMKAAHPKALIQPSQQLRRGRVLRSIGQPFLAFDPPVVCLEFYWTHTDNRTTEININLWIIIIINNWFMP